MIPQLEKLLSVEPEYCWNLAIGKKSPRKNVGKYEIIVLLINDVKIAFAVPPITDPKYKNAKLKLDEIKEKYCSSDSDSNATIPIDPLTEKQFVESAIGPKDVELKKFKELSIRIKQLERELLQKNKQLKDKDTQLTEKDDYIKELETKIENLEIDGNTVVWTEFMERADFEHEIAELNPARIQIDSTGDVEADNAKIESLAEALELEEHTYDNLRCISINGITITEKSLRYIFLIIDSYTKLEKVDMTDCGDVLLSYNIILYDWEIETKKLLRNNIEVLY